jgi:hypothetical protein
MNKKLLIIGGGIVVIGAGAYFYFMNKKEKDALAVDTQNPTSGTNVTPTSGTTTPKSDSVAPALSGLDVYLTQEDINLPKAKELIFEIVKAEKSNSNFVRNLLGNKFRKELKDLGYTYDSEKQKLTKL